jgi:hypothetical protein
MNCPAPKNFYISSEKGLDCLHPMLDMSSLQSHWRHIRISTTFLFSLIDFARENGMINSENDNGAALRPKPTPLTEEEGDLEQAS